MPRIIYVILFLIFTLAPFPFIWITQTIFNIPTEQQKSVSTSQTSKTTHSHHHYSPMGWFFLGNAMGGRGNWLNQSYRNNSSSTKRSNRVFNTSRSYSGGLSSFSGGGFGSFGK